MTKYSFVDFGWEGEVLIGREDELMCRIIMFSVRNVDTESSRQLTRGEVGKRLLELANTRVN